MSESRKTEKTTSDGVPFSAEIRAAVKAELDAILAAPFFAQSKRCKGFLRHIVLQTLAGNASQLKERTVGIEVFDRPSDYDAGEDAIVRVTANDVRKRIGQFYQDSPNAHSVQIDLPRGTYVPQFRIQPKSQSNESSVAAPSDNPVEESSKSEPSSPIPFPAPAAQPAPDAGIHPDLAKPDIPPGNHPHARWRSFVLPAIILATGLALVGIWMMKAHDNSPQLWESFLHAKAPVLVCLGTHNIPDASAPSSAETEDVVMRKETIPIDDAMVVTSMARMLGDKGIPFRLVAAEATSLTDLQAQPVILLGGIDNQWTLQLTQALRYRIETSYPSGADKPPVASIVDSQQPSAEPWKADFSVPLSAWKRDYAVLAKENDPTIGVPVLIEAGLGDAGSLAASKFVASGELAKALENEPSCKGKSNFEAVIQTEIIDASPGPPHTLRLICW